MHTSCHHAVGKYRCRNPLHCFVPPHITDELAKSSDVRIRDIGLDAVAVSAAMRSMREVMSTMPMRAAMRSPKAEKHRLVYDMSQRRFPLPGRLVRSEGDGPVGDAAVDEAYDYSGVTYDVYKELFDRNSLDDRGMTLVSSVHYGRNIANAFWNGEQMLYGDGDGQIFLSFTKSLEVVAHELTHGVIMYEANLVYEDEPGALNESFADVMSAVVEQRHKNQSVTEASWLVGDELVGPAVEARAFRSFTEEPAYDSDPILGTDPQPKHYADIYRGHKDNGGVHINSGIANHAFYRVAMELGGNSWDKAGPIWYKALTEHLRRYSQFQDCADATHRAAAELFGAGSAEQKAVASGWDAVGLQVSVGV